MPTYEYRCPEGHDFEDFVLKISDAKSELPCPTCGKRAAKRVSAGAGLLFKGSGFYITDYGKDGKKDQRPAAKPAESSSSPSASSSGKSSEATGASGTASSTASGKSAASAGGSGASTGSGSASGNTGSSKSGPAK